MNAFIIKIKDGAIAAQKKYSILASLTIAQAILETGWGKSSIGNNIFGIKEVDIWLLPKFLAG
jgi:flagellum-specific peptidoglycan hydrolase FlgJ